MATETLSLAELLKANDVPDGVLAELADTPFKIKTVTQLANYFEDKSEIRKLYGEVSTKYKDEGNVIANLKQAWREAESIVQRSLKRSADGLPDEDLDDPLRQAVDTSLKSQFLAKYSFSIPSSWLGVASLIGRLHREFQKRSHVAPRVDKVRTVDKVSEMGNVQKRHKLDKGCELVVGTSQSYQSITSTFGYVQALQALLYSMCYAGSYKVAAPDNDDSKDALMLPLEPCLNHLANAQKFVAMHSGKVAEHVVLKMLTRIDEKVRGKWAEAFRATSKSMGTIIAETDSFATTLWMADIQESQATQPQSGGQARPIGKQAERKDFRGGQQPKQGKGGGKASSNLFVDKIRSTAIARYGSGIKTCKVDRGGKQLCKAWNDNRGGKGCTFTNCTQVHACDVQLPDGSPCGDKGHKRINHTGPTVPFE